ncbi:MAG: SgcJ/EcaC family oxidoreductase [Ramlibacter sp.]
MTRLSRVILLLSAALASFASWAGPGEDAVAVVERWSATYSANDADALVALYTSDAVLLGTVSPVMSEGTAAIQTYFSRLKGSGNKNSIRERRVMVLADDAVMVTGFYDFSNAERTPALRPSRYTMLVIQQGKDWRIAHHHSSPLVPPPK